MADEIEVQKVTAEESVVTGAMSVNGAAPGIYLAREQALVYSIHIREVLDTLPQKFEDGPPDDSVEMLLYMAITDLMTLSRYIDHVMMHLPKT